MRKFIPFLAFVFGVFGLISISNALINAFQINAKNSIIEKRANIEIATSNGGNRTITRV